jgi:hypothetical protein
MSACLTLGGRPDAGAWIVDRFTAAPDPNQCRGIAQLALSRRARVGEICKSTDTNNLLISCGFGSELGTSDSAQK